MGLRKRKDSEEVVPENGDDFDIVPLDVKPKNIVRMPVGGILTPDKVSAVKFQQDKSGYAFSQVDIFIEQVAATLTYHEDKDHEKNLKIHDLEESLADSLEKQSVLQQTIGVFKVKGDVLVSGDGSYLTESQTASKSETIQQIQALTEENTSLKHKLSLSERDAQEAWVAYDSIREHIEKTLEPFIREKLELLATLEQELAKLQDTRAAVEAPLVVEASEEAEDLLDDSSFAESEEEPVAESTFEAFTQVQPLGKSPSKGWDDAPSAEVIQEDKLEDAVSSVEGEREHDGEDERKSSLMPVAPAISDETAQRRKAILLLSPEVAELESSAETIEIEIETIDFVEEYAETQTRPDLLALAPELSIDEGIENDPTS